MKKLSALWSWLKESPENFQRAWRHAQTRPTPEELQAVNLSVRKKQRTWLAWVPLILRETWYLIRSNDLNTKSGSLTYSCILSFGPLLAVIFLFFHQFGGLEKLINETLVPLLEDHFSPAVAVQLQQYLLNLVSNFRPEVLGPVALVTFLITVIGLLSSIEGAFNDIFAVKVRRPLWRKALNYWTLLTLSPVIIAFSSTKTAQLMNTFPTLQEILQRVSFLAVPFTIISQCLGFAILFFMLANKFMPINALILGGTCAGLLFKFLQYINVFLTRNLLGDSTATQLYGTAPIIAVAFFLWIKLVWIVVLTGACLSMAIASLRENGKYRQPTMEPLDFLLHCTNVFAYVCRDFRHTGRGLTAAQVARGTSTSDEEASMWLDWLERHHVIFQASAYGTSRYFPTHRGLRLEKHPERFVHKLLLPRLGVDTSSLVPNTPAVPAALGNAFTRRVVAILYGHLDTTSPHDEQETPEI